MAEPQAPGHLHQPPDHLTEGQREVWRYAVANAPANVLKAIDSGVLAAYVMASDQHRQAAIKQAEIDRTSSLPLLIKSKDGALVISPYVRLMSRAAETMIRCAGELGFTPAARTRLAGPNAPLPTNDPASPWRRLRLLQGGIIEPPPSA